MSFGSIPAQAQSFAYVTNRLADSVSVINTATNIVVATVAVGDRPTAVAITPNGAFVYVTNTDDDSVSVIDTEDNTVVATVAVGSDPRGIAITPNGNFVYVVNQESDDVTVIATDSNNVETTVDVGDGPRSAAITPDGAFVYVTNGLSDSVSVIATASNTVVDTVAVGDNPKNIAITPDGDFVYVVNQADGDVTVIDTTGNTIEATVDVGDDPAGVAITPDGAFAYVMDLADDSVSVILTTTNTVVARVAVSDQPRGVAITPNGVDITVTPSVAIPIVVPTGGITFDMDVTVDNNTGSTLNATVWHTVTLPSGEEIGPPGGDPLGNLPDSTSISVPDGGQFDTTFVNFEIPGGVKSGSYLFNWKVGTLHTNVPLDRDLFPFSKANGPTFTKAGDDDWGLNPSKEATVPEKFSLEQNYPNPFNPETEIRFQLPEASQVLVRIFNILGQETRTLTDREYAAGFHRVRWDAKDNNGNAVSSGIYLYRLQTGSFSQIRKMTLLR